VEGERDGTDRQRERESERMRVIAASSRTSLAEKEPSHYRLPHRLLQASRHVPRRWSCTPHFIRLPGIEARIGGAKM